MVKEFKPPLEQNYKSLMERSKGVDMVLTEKKEEISEFKDLLSHAIVERERALMNTMEAVKESHFQQSRACHDLRTIHKKIARDRAASNAV